MTESQSGLRHRRSHEVIDIPATIQEMDETASAFPELKRLKKYMETAAQFIGSYAVQYITPSNPEEPKNKIFMAQTILLLLLAISMSILFIMINAPFTNRNRTKMFYLKLFIYGSNLIMILVPLFLLVIHAITYTILAPLPILAILVIIYLVRRGSSPENYRDYDGKLDKLMELCSGWTFFAFGGLSFLVFSTPAQLKNDVTECFLYCTIVIGLLVMLITSVPPKVHNQATSFTTMRMVKIVESLRNTLLALLILVGLMATGEIVQGFVVVSTFLHIAGATFWFIKELNHEHEDVSSGSSTATEPNVDALQQNRVLEEVASGSSAASQAPNVHEIQQNPEPEEVASRTSTSLQPYVDEIQLNREYEVGNMSSRALLPNVDEQRQPNRESEHGARWSLTATTPNVDDVLPNYFGAFLLAGLIFVHSRNVNNSDGKNHDIPLFVCMLSLCSAFICCLSRMFILANSANTPAWTSAKLISLYITYFSVVVAFIASFVFATKN